MLSKCLLDLKLLSYNDTKALKADGMYLLLLDYKRGVYHSAAGLELCSAWCVDRVLHNEGTYAY